MIDTHCHLLPALDDGPRTREEAVELARRLADQGVAVVVCTPHFSRRYPTSHELARERFEATTADLRAAGVELELVLAAEIGPAHTVSSPLGDLAERSIGRRYLLVEVQPDTPGAFFASAAGRLAEGGLQPIFAHPERCRAVARHGNALDAARAQGALVQVVAPSLIGRGGAEIAATAWRLVERGQVDLLASDAHGVRRRRVRLRDACALVDRRVGEEVRRRLTERNPVLVLEGRHPAAY